MKRDDEALHRGLPRDPARAPKGHHPSRHQTLERSGRELERQPIPKVIDFGIAKATQGRLMDATFLTAAEHFMGTPAYMSPEQAGGNPADIDTRSDIYSLGELLTGNTPFDRKSLSGSGPDEIRRRIRTVEPILPSARVSRSHGTTARIRRSADEIRGDLDWIVMKALEKETARRYESASALAADIQRHLAHEPLRRGRPAVFICFEKRSGGIAWHLARRRRSP